LAKVLFRIAKGFLYGTVIGLFFATAIYLMASAVQALNPSIPDPAVLFGVIFGGSVLVGVAAEYDVWLKLKEKAAE